MKSYYACDHATWLEKVRELGPTHGVTLPDGKFFFTGAIDPHVVVELQKRPDFIELPPLYDPEPLAELSKAFPYDIVTSDDTMLKAIQKISALNPAFKP